MQALNTAVANGILALSKSERRALTSKSFAHVEIGSAWINQTIRSSASREGTRFIITVPIVWPVFQPSRRWRAP